MLTTETPADFEFTITALSVEVDGEDPQTQDEYLKIAAQVETPGFSGRVVVSRGDDDVDCEVSMELVQAIGEERALFIAEVIQVLAESAPIEGAR